MAYKNLQSALSTHRPAARVPRWYLGLLACVLGQVAQATPEEPPVAQQQEASDITYLCAPARSSLILSDQLKAPLRGYETRSVDLAALIVHGEEDSRGEVRRIGAKSLSSECGTLTVIIQGAYYNSNPQGELGAAEDYAVVTIHQGARVLLGPIALGTCSKGNPRYDIHAKCPDQWATRVEMHSGQDGTYSVTLQHAYDEWLQVAP